MTMLKVILLVFIVFYFIGTIQLGWSVDCPQNERNALLDFKQGLIDQTNRLSSWVGQDCCKWEGVSCDNFTGHVVSLNLRNPFPFDKDRYFDSYPYYDKTYSEACLVAVGEVSPSLLELRHLNYLDLSWNNFSGIAIPTFFGLFHELTYLNLSSAQFGGIVPHHLGNLSALHSLDLGTNYLVYRYVDSPILVVNTLHWTAGLVSLRHLVLSQINLSNIPPDSFQAITSFPSLLELRFSYCSLEKIPLFHSTPANLTSLTILDLSYNRFQGPIPSAIRNMTSLKVLQLSDNMFSSNGAILDELKNLNKLEVLDLSNNRFAGKMIESWFPNFSSPSIGDNLETLKLSENQLTGYLPNWLHQLKGSLKFLHLSYNSFEGGIPTSFTALQNLKELFLFSNQLSGYIPTSLNRLSALTKLDLYSNQFNGTVPECIGQLSQLTYLDLSFNKFHGVVSELHFAKLSKLKILYLEKNFLSIKIKSSWDPPFQLEAIDLDSCDVGPQFPDWLETQTRLQYLGMSNSSISDSIPNWFQTLISLDTLDLSGNQIYGKVPSFTKRIWEMSLSSNRFEGSLPKFPSSLGILDLSNNKFIGPIRADIGYTLPNIQFLSLSNNNINGTIPNSLCKMLSLEILDFSNNHLSGVLPHCLDDLQNVEVIDLASNNLSGNIKRSFCHQSEYLESLHLSKNNFHGEFPLSLENCTRLSVLDVSDNKFSGEIPTWIGQSLYFLRILKLSSNKYNGSLSPKLCHLNKLQVLDVAGNNLSGNIPHCFGNFSSMLFNQTYSSDFYYGDEGTYEDQLSQIIKGRELEYTNTLRFVTNLDLSNNNFVGQIPEQLTNLSGLIGLNLSTNNFTGRIPKEIGQMRSLESLDLSNNRLSSRIPQSISMLTSLSYLNLSNNNLSGPIPLGNQLQTLNDASIYDGNIELCGLPLEKKCTKETDRKVKGQNNGDGDGDEFITLWFYIGMASGFVVGFWGFCCVLLFKKTWRYAYFRFVDDWMFFPVVGRKVRRKKH